MAKAVVARCHGLLPWHSRTFFLIFRCICTALVRAAAPDSYSLLSVFLFSSSSFFRSPDRSRADDLVLQVGHKTLDEDEDTTCRTTSKSAQLRLGGVQEGHMNLVLRRDQRKSLLGKTIFQLEVRAEIFEEEWQSIQRYRLGDTVLYTQAEIVERGSGLLGLASRLAFHAVNISISVNDLVNGKRIECKNILEMLAVEAQIKEAAITFKQVLNAATHFGGEEVLAL